MLLARDHPLVEIELTELVLVREIIRGAGDDAVELVEAVRERVVLGEKPEVPFADERCVVPDGLDQRRDGRVSGW